MTALSRPRRSMLLPLALTMCAVAAAACGGGAAAPRVGAPPASSHAASERAATLNWLAKTNQMRARGSFAAVDQVTTGEMRAIYQHEQKQSDGNGPAFQLTGLSITIPCQRGPIATFVAYGDTDVFTLGDGMQPVAMAFQRVGGAWKLAVAVDYPGGSGWPALCRQPGGATSVPVVLSPGRYTPDLAAVLTGALTGVTPTAAAAAPFAVNGFLSGAGSVSAEAASWIRQDHSAGVTFAGRFTAAPEPTLALPLADGRGYWLIGFLTQTGTHDSAAGLRKASWPDQTPVATPRPAVVHYQTDTYITAYAATDPRPAPNARVTLDGFFGWHLASSTN
jgi:hypothetical protein